MNRTIRERIERPLWPVLYVLSPVVPLATYFAGNWSSFFHSWSLSMVFGIFAYVWYLNQFIIAARPVYWERLYGLDRMYSFHGYMAIVATLFVVVHVVLKRLLFPVITFQQALGGTAATIFLIVVLATLIFMVQSRLARLRPLDRLRRYAAERLRWQYHHLKLFHNLVVVAAFLILAHVLLAFSTLESFLRISVMAAWFVVALGLYGWHKVVKPARARKQPFTVQEVVRESDSVTTVRIAPPEGRTIRLKAGQFAYFRFLEGTPGPEEHPFTISSSPHAPYLEFTAKNLGDFSGGLAALEAGATVLVDGPYGVFRSDRVPAERPLVFIAGGIGITPFLSMLGAMATTGSGRSDRAIHLLWSVSTPDDICMIERIAEYKRNLPGLSVEIFVSRAESAEEVRGIPDAFGRTAGRIDTERLVQRGLVGTGRDFFLCGPREMMMSQIEGLRSHGISPRQIHFEAFAM